MADMSVLAPMLLMHTYILSCYHADVFIRTAYALLP